MSTPDPFADAEAAYLAESKRKPEPTAPALAPPMDPLANVEQEYLQAAKGPSMGLALKQNPDQVGKNLTNARTAGVPPDFAAKAPDQTALLARQTTIDQLLAKAPSTREAMASPQFAALAHDDVENLSAVEQVLSDVMYASRAFDTWPSYLAKVTNNFGRWTADTIQNIALALGPTPKEGEFDPMAMASDWFTRMAEANQRQINSLQGDARGHSRLATGVASGIQSAGNSLAGIGIGMMTGRPEAVALGLAGASTAFPDYAEARDKGLGYLDATTYGGITGAVEIATEMLPVGKLFGDLKAGSSFWKLMLHQAATEVPGEQVATLLQDAAAWAYLNPEKTLQQFLEERPGAALDTLIATLAGTAVQGGLAHGFHKLAGSPLAQTEAEHTRDSLKQLHDLWTDSRVRTRSAPDFATFVQQAAGPDSQNVYVKASDLRDVLEQSGTSHADLAAISPDLAKQFQEAVQDGGHRDVVVPIGEWAAKVAPSPLGEALLDHARLREDAMSAKEAADAKSTEEALVAEAESKLKGAKDFIDRSKSAALVHASVTEALRNAYGDLFTNDQRAAGAALWRAFYINLGDLTGRMPHDILTGKDGKRAIAPAFFNASSAEHLAATSPQTLTSMLSSVAPITLPTEADGPHVDLRAEHAAMSEHALANWRSTEYTLGDGTKTNISRQGIKKMLSHAKPGYMRALVKAVPELLPNARPWKQVVAEDGRKFTYYAAPVIHDGKQYAATFEVREDAGNPRQLYDVTMVSYESLRSAIDAKTASANNSGGVPADAPQRVQRIVQWMADSNPFNPGGALSQEGWHPAPADLETLDVDGVTRPARTSDGYLIHPYVEGIENFWRNMGDTKVVDDLGRPVVVFHGTPFTLAGDRFDPAYLGKNTGAPSAREGFFFSGSANTAESDDYLGDQLDENTHGEFAAATQNAWMDLYPAVKAAIDAGLTLDWLKGSLGLFLRTDWDSERGVKLADKDGWQDLVIPTSISAADRLRDTATTWADDLRWQLRGAVKEAEDGAIPYANVEKLRDALRLAERPVHDDNANDLLNLDTRTAGRVYSMFLALSNPMVHDFQGSPYREVSYFNLIKQAKAAGHDGLIIRNTFDGGGLDDIYVAFDNKQIKSAVDSNGNFDRTDENFYHQLNLDNRQDTLDSPRFKAWARGPLIQHGASGDWEGFPGGVVFEAYHGTTHSGITEVNTVGSEGSEENFLGAGFYATTSSDDASRNYAGKGPDLLMRIGIVEDSILSDLDPHEIFSNGWVKAYFAAHPERLDGWAREIGVEPEALNSEEMPDGNIEETNRLLKDVAHEQATKQVAGDAPGGLMMPLFVRFDNALDLRPEGAWLQSEVEYETPGDPESGIVGFKGNGAALLDAIDSVWASRNFHDVRMPERFASRLDELRFDGAFRAIDVFNAISGLGFDQGQMLQEAAREAGFDGIVMDAYQSRFGASMRLEPGTLHLMPFVAQNVKSSIGNDGRFSLRQRQILNQDAPLSNFGFYSPLTRALDAAEPGKAAKGVTPAPRKGTAEEWKKWLDGAQQKGMFRGEERIDTQLDTWLATREGAINYGDVHNYMVENAVHVEQIQLTEQEDMDEDAYMAAIDEYVEDYRRSYLYEWDEDRERERSMERSIDYADTSHSVEEVTEDDDGNELPAPKWEVRKYLSSRSYQVIETFDNENEAEDRAYTLNDEERAAWADNDYDERQREHEAAFDEDAARDSAYDSVDRDEYKLGGDRTVQFKQYTKPLPDGDSGSYVELLMRARLPKTNTKPRIKSAYFILEATSAGAAYFIDGAYGEWVVRNANTMEGVAPPFRTREAAEGRMRTLELELDVNKPTRRSLIYNMRRDFTDNVADAYFPSEGAEAKFSFTDAPDSENGAPRLRVDVDAAGLDPERLVEALRFIAYSTSHRIVEGEIKGAAPQEPWTYPGHWGSDVGTPEDVIGHLRADSVKGQNLFRVHEFQSDVHQQARDAGYTSGHDYTVSLRTEKGEQLSILEYGTGETREFGQMDRALGQALRPPRTDSDTEAAVPVPSLPFKKSWENLLIRRAVHEAVMRGLPRIGWTTGDQQAERYGGHLRQMVDTIELSVNADDPTKFDVLAYQNGRSKVAERGKSKLDVRNLLGDEMSRDLLARVTPDEPAHLEGDGIRIGGAGMRAFYDQKVPNLFKTLFKKHKLEPKLTTIPSPNFREAKWRRDPGDGQIQLLTVRDEDHLAWVHNSFTWTDGQAQAYVDKYNATKGGYPFWVVDLPQSLVDEVEQGLPLYQNQSDPKATIEFNAGQAFANITMGAKADFTSFVHETAHFMLEAYADLIRHGDAPEQVKQDMATFLKWAGYAGTVEQWCAQSIPERRVHHEKFARTFEAYATSGRTPSAELAGLFAKLRNFMLEIYRTFRGKQVKVAPEIEGVMSRMLASKEAVDRMTEARKEVALLNPANRPEGMTDFEWKEYEAQARAANDFAQQTLQARTLRDMKWLSNAKSKALKALQRKAAGLRAGVRNDLMAQATKLPVYRALGIIAKGEIPDGKDLPRALRRVALDASQASTKLSTTMLREQLGDHPAAAWRHLPSNLLAAENGADPSMIAQLAGFDSADAMVKAIVASPSIDEFVSAETDRRMLEEHGEFSDPDALDKAADLAVHNAFRERFLASELRALERAAGNRSSSGQAAIAHGRNMVLSIKLRELNPDSFARAAQRAADAAMKLFGKGKTVEAASEKRNQLVNFAAAREAARVKAEVARLARRLAKLRKASIRGAVGQEAMDQIESIMARFGLLDPNDVQQARTVTLADYVAAQDALGVGLELPAEITDESFRASLDDLTVEQALGVLRGIRTIEQSGRNARALIIAGRQKALEAVKAEVLPSITAAARGRKVDNTTRNTAGNKAKRMFRGFLAVHRKFASLVRELDGFKDAGPLWRSLVYGMNQAGDREAQMRLEATQALVRLMKPLKQGPRLAAGAQMIKSIGRSFTREERIATALNVGNAGNLQRLMDGNAWTRQQVDDVLATLTKEEWQFVQGVWDLFESYKPAIAAKEKRVTGVEPDWVEPTQVTTKFGTLRGGYYPVKYDTAQSARAEAFASAEDAKQLMRAAYTASTTRRSFTKSRSVQVKGRPLLLTLAGVEQGLNEVVHDLAWHEWVIGANTLLRDSDVDAAIRSGFGAEVIREMRDHVTAIATQDQQQSDAFTRVVSKLRHNTTMVGLGFNLVTSAMQITGFPQSAVRVGPKWMAKGLRRFVASPIVETAFVKSKSSMMQTRLTTMQREINELLNTVSATGAAKQRMTSAAMVLIGKMQQQVDVPTWLAGYEKALANGESEEIAIGLADQMVIDAQGGGQIKDLASIQRGSALKKLFTNFYSFFNTTWNLNVEQTKKRAAAGEWVGLATDLLLINIVPCVMSVLIRQAISPGGGGDGDEPWYSQVPGEIVSFLLGQLVGVRELTGSVKALVDTEMDTKAFGFDYQGPAGLRFLAEFGKLMKQVSQGEIDMPAIKAAINTLGLVTGIPTAQLNRTIAGATALYEGETDDPRALVSGPPK